MYGAFVAASGGPKILSASAASPAVAQLLSHAAGDAAVEDVAPAPRGGALASSVLPLVLAGIVTGVLAAVLGSSGFRRAALAVTGSLLAGVAATLIVQTWLDIIEGSWVANAAALSLTVLAVAAAVAGGYSLLGERGAVLVALTMVLVGNPFSAVGSAPELLPPPVGGLGQLLPPGCRSKPGSEHWLLRRRGSRWPHRCAAGVGARRGGADPDSRRRGGRGSESRTRGMPLCRGRRRTP